MKALRYLKLGIRGTLVTCLTIPLLLICLVAVSPIVWLVADNDEGKGFLYNQWHDLFDLFNWAWGTDYFNVGRGK